jgi:integrase
VKAKVSKEWAFYTERFILPTIRQTAPRLDMAAWTEEHLEQWWARVQAQCTSARANKVLTRFKHMMKTAKRWKVIPDDPSTHLRKVKEPEREYPSLSEHNQARLLDGCRDALRGYVLFALYTGARRSSLAKLEHRDIDLARGEILFRKTKNGKDYRVPIHPALWNTLGDRLSSPIGSDKQTGCPCCVKRGFRACQHVLHQYVQLNAVSKGFARLARRCGMPGFRFHDLRHCVGSRLAEAGANQKVIMEVLGHKTNVMSLRYTHVQRDAIRDAMEKHL